MTGLGMEEGSKPGPGSRTTISMPRASSQATSHSTIFWGSPLAPCTTALARASVSANSIASSFPLAHCILRTTSIIPCTTGSTAFRSADRVTFNLSVNLSGSKQPFEVSTPILPSLCSRYRCDPGAHDSTEIAETPQCLHWTNPRDKLEVSIDLAFNSRQAGEIFQLPPPIEFIHKGAGIAPTRLYFH